MLRAPETHDEECTCYTCRPCCYSAEDPEHLCPVHDAEHIRRRVALAEAEDLAAICRESWWW